MCKRKNVDDRRLRLLVEPYRHMFSHNEKSVSIRVGGFDKYIYKNAHIFADHFTYLFKMYIKYRVEKRKVGIKNFLIESIMEDPNYMGDVIFEASCRVYGDYLHFIRDERKLECLIKGIFYFEDYTVVHATDYLSFRHQYRNEHFVYTGGGAI